MVAAPQTATTKLNGKQIKSKNQYKREKAKLKKATASNDATLVSMFVGMGKFQADQIVIDTEWSQTGTI